MLRTIKKDDWPDWIKERLEGRKNLEVKESNGNFYLYEYQNVWDKKLKQPRKEVWYRGPLKRHGNRIYEHGHVAFLLHLLTKHKILEKLKKHFRDEWKVILVFSLNRVIHPSPLKRMGSWMEKTSLVKLLSIDHLSPKKISKTLANIGTNIKSQTTFMRELIESGEVLLYDGTVIYSTSNYNKLLEIGYDKDKLFLPKANITLLFSKDRNVPIYSRLFFGSVHEINTIRAIIEEIGNNEIILIGDKGYYKNKLFDDLDDEGIEFIIPLPRDDRRIDYTKNLSMVFEFRDRIIKYTSYSAGDYYVYMFEDQLLKYEETTNYYRLKLKGKKLEFHEEWAGKISILSNRKDNPKEIYLMWKSRDRIEKVFHILQNILETDRPYVSKEEVFRGYIFASFISLIIYYLVMNLLKKHKINDRVSVEDIIFEFSKIMVEERKYPTLAEVPEKVRKLSEKIGVYNIVTKIWG